jgi:hypothetical protein
MKMIQNGIHHISLISIDIVFVFFLPVDHPKTRQQVVQTRIFGQKGPWAAHRPLP